LVRDVGGCRLAQGHGKEDADGDKKGRSKTGNRRKTPSPQGGADQRSGDGANFAGDAQPGKERSAFGFGGPLLIACLLGSRHQNIQPRGEKCPAESGAQGPQDEQPEYWAATPEGSRQHEEARSAHRAANQNHGPGAEAVREAAAG